MNVPPDKSGEIAASLLANLPCVAFRCAPDPGRELLYISGAVKAVTGYSVEDFRRGEKHLVDLLPNSERHRLSLGSPEPVLAGFPGGTHFRLCHAGGGVRRVWESSRVVRDERGQALFVDGILLDLSGEVDSANLDQASALREAQPALRQEPLARILLAEDNPTNQMVTQEILVRRGYEVESVGGGAAAIAALEEKPYDLVLMDISMPELDGIETTRVIRASDGPMARIPILALTAHAQPKDTAIFLASGMDDVVAKPIVSGHRLLQAVGKALVKDLAERNSRESAHGQAGQNGGALIFDPTTLLRLAVAVGPEAMDRLRISFPDDLRKGIIALDRALAERDIDALQRASHLLKSISGTFGATELHRLASEVNEDCQDMSGESLFLKARRLEVAVSQAFDAFHQLFGEPGWGLRAARSRPGIGEEVSEGAMTS